MCYERRRAEDLVDFGGLVCPSRTSERGGKGYCVKGGWGEDGERVKERALGVRLRYSPQRTLSSTDSVLYSHYNCAPA